MFPKCDFLVKGEARRDLDNFAKKVSLYLGSHSNDEDFLNRLQCTKSGTVCVIYVMT